MRRCRGRAAGFLLAAAIAGQALAGDSVEITSGVVSGTLLVSAWNDDSYLVLGDTQQFATDAQRADDYSKIATWYCNNRDALDLVAFVTVGDNVDTSNSTQWGRIDPIFDQLDACYGIAYVPTLGNHDVSPVPQDYITANDATLFHQNLGADRLTSAKWWFKERSDFTLQWYTGDTRPRSYVAEPAGPLSFISAEWGLNSQLSVYHSTYYPVMQWVERMVAKYPKQMMFIVSHEDMCGLSPNCTDFNDNSKLLTLASRSPNLVGGISGHWNASSCAAGWGFFRQEPVTAAVGVQRSANLLLGGTDHSCATRAYGTSPYGWNTLLQWHRTSRTLCMRTIRVIDATLIPATILGSPDYDRTDNSNDPETCVYIPPIYS